MEGYKSNIEKDTLENNNFRKVVYTSEHMQLVLMTLKGGEDIGEETHPKNDQFFRIESGKGKCIIDDHVYLVKDGDAVIVPAGAKHNVINTDPENELRLYTIYGPPDHKDGLRFKTKEAAEEGDKEFDGKRSVEFFCIGS